MALNGWITPAAHFCTAFFSFIYCLILNTVGTGQRRGRVPVFSYYLTILKKNLDRVFQGPTDKGFKPVTGGNRPPLFSELLSTQNNMTMKEFFEIMGKDIYDEHFSTREYVIYGILTPLVLVGIMALAGWLETL